MLRYLLVITSVCAMLVSVSSGADKLPEYTQKDFARQVIQRFSWNAGLPKEPADRDYLVILGGKRTYRYEAESAYNEQTDLVSLRTYPLLGEFTGKGWIQGVSSTTYSTFTILLPIAGEFDVKAVIKGDGFIWSVDNKAFRADSKSGNFKETHIGRVKLNAGVVTISITIPPDGAIDSFSLTASDVTPVQPFNGWRFREKLTAVRMAEVAVALTNRYDQLPDADPSTYPKPIFVAEKVTLPPTAVLTTASYLGRFASEKWIRADYRGVALKFPLTVAETGYYELTVNIMGETISGAINNREFSLSAKAYLDKVNLGLYRLEAGDNEAIINLPPAGGIDSLAFTKKNSAPDDFLRLAGVPGPADRLITAEEASVFLKSISESYSLRK